MRAGSSGTWTFLFTDIEGSTRLWEEHPDEMRAALTRHDALVRDSIEAHGGRVVKSRGDGAHAVFTNSLDGVRAAVAAQVALAREEWAEGVPLRVRMGIHAGYATERDGDYYGPDVNRAARVASAAHGGQIVCTAVIADLAGSGGALVDLGEHRLRDLQSPVHLFQIDPPGPPVTFPPLRSLDAYRSNLPYELSSFVGRDEELRSLAKQMRSARVVSIVGVGGVGKTRLALQVGSELLPDYRDGVWLCELAQVQEPEGLPDAVAAAVGYVPPQGVPVSDGLPRYLERKDLLVILDNCEHLVDAVAEFATSTTARAPSVSLLVTSREALGVRGEHIAPLGSLSLPSVAEPDEVLASDAGALFVARAGEARGEFAVDAVNAPAVRDLCARLDGIPLAIELAAAQTNMMTPAEILTRLDKQFRLLTGGRRARLERHQTLRAAIDWSYDLLGVDERALLDRLAVCVGGFDLDAAVAIAAGIGADEFEAFELLASLVAKSLVERNERDGVTRYRLLEMIRQYAAERLNATDAAEAARDDHSRHYLAVAIDLSREASTPSGFEALERLDTEIANIAAAGRWLLATDRVADLLAFYDDLPFVDPFALPVAVPEELGAIAGEAIEMPDAASHPGYPTACYSAGVPVFFVGDIARYRSLAELARAAPSGESSVTAAYMAAVVAVFDGDPDGAVAAATRAVELARRSGDRAQLAWMLGQHAAFAGALDAHAGLRSAEEALVVARATASPVVSLYPLVAITSVARQIDPQRALEAANECIRLDITQRRVLSGLVKGMVAGIHLLTGRIGDALAAWREILGTYDDTGERSMWVIAVADCAQSLVPIEPHTAMQFAAIAESDDLAPYAAFGFGDLARLAEERPADAAAARHLVASLSKDDATALIFATLERLIAEYTSADT